MAYNQIKSNHLTHWSRGILRSKKYISEVFDNLITVQKPLHCSTAGKIAQEQLILKLVRSLLLMKPFKVLSRSRWSNLRANYDVGKKRRTQERGLSKNQIILTTNCLCVPRYLRHQSLIHKIPGFLNIIRIPNPLALAHFKI